VCLFGLNSGDPPTGGNAPKQKGMTVGLLYNDGYDYYYAFAPTISSSIGGTPGRLVVTTGIDTMMASRRTKGHHQRLQRFAAATASIEADEQQSMGIVGAFDVYPRLSNRLLGLWTEHT
jgi:hypothetical protein